MAIKFSIGSEEHKLKIEENYWGNTWQVSINGYKPHCGDDGFRGTVTNAAVAKTLGDAFHQLAKELEQAGPHQPRNARKYYEQDALPKPK